MLTAAPSLPVIPDDVVRLAGGPDTLDHYLAIVQGRPNHALITFDGEALTLVSPKETHERTAWRADKLVAAYLWAARTSYRAYGSTLYRVPGRPPGVQPDHSYYIANFERVRRKEINLAVDPPPDLVVEVVVTHDPRPAQEVCRILGVPELWQLFPASGTATFLHRTASGPHRGQYRPRVRSRALPRLTVETAIRLLFLEDLDDDVEFDEHARATCRTLVGR
jgi:Uma2 family endonuclease